VIKKNIKSYLFLVFLFSIMGCSHTSEKLVQAEKIMENNPDSALAILHSVKPTIFTSASDKALYALLYSKAENKIGIIPSSDSLINRAIEYYDESEPRSAGYAWFLKSRFSQNYEDKKQQVSALMRAEEYAAQSGDNKLRAIILSDKAELYYSQQKYDSALVCYKHAAISFQAAHDTYNTIICLLRIGDIFIYKANTDSAIVYNKIAEKLAIKLQNPALTSTIYRTFGRFYSIKNNYQQALYFYRKVPITNSSLYDESKDLLLADAYLNTNRLDSATYYLNRINEHQNDNSYYAELWMKINKKKGNYKQALFYSQRVTTINDLLSKINLDISFAGLEKKYTYQHLQLKNQHLTLRNRSYIIMLLIASLFVGILSFSFLWWRNQTRKREIKAQQQLIDQEHKLLEEETANLKLVEQQLEKEKLLLDKETANNKLMEQQLKMQQILYLNMEQYRQYAHKKKESTHPASPVDNLAFYDELITCMDLEYNNISCRLKAVFQELNERDILICCLILAGFDSGMMASILDMQVDSINKRRYRIRTKMNIESELNMAEYLRNFKQ